MNFSAFSLCFCILRDYPGINPDVGSFFWDHIFQIRIFFLCINCLTGIDHADAASFPIILSRTWSMTYACTRGFCSIRDSLPQSVHPGLWNSENSQDISVPRQKHHGLNPASECCPCISIPENGPAVYRLIHHRLIIKNSHGSPAIWHRVFILRIKLP